MARPRVYVLQGSAYGKLKGFRVYYSGFKVRPKFLPAKGRGFGGLKHLLEQLAQGLKKFTLTFDSKRTSITKQGRTYKVRLSEESVKRLRARKWEAGREMNLRLAAQHLHETFPKYFKTGHPGYTYRRGMFSELLQKGLDPRAIAPEDRAALTKFVLDTRSTRGDSALDIPKVYDAAKDRQLLYLRQLAEEFERNVDLGHAEAWWQDYFSRNILYFQSNYITRIEKMNTAVVATKFPDFAVATADGYLDIIEIKRPDTELLKEDASRHNYYWSVEIAKAISQVENYIDGVTRHADAIMSELRDKNIDIRIIRPRGLIFAGKAAALAGNPKMGDDFRRLNLCLKNVEIVPYDEISRNIRNTIESIRRLSKTTKVRLRRGKA